MSCSVNYIGALLFLCWYNSGSLAQVFSPGLSESQKIAMEGSGALLPSTDLSARIAKDLGAIRKQFPDVSCIKHYGSWETGKLLITNVSNKTLDAINASEYGPITVTNIFFQVTFVVTFSKPYNPVKLAEVLQQKFKFEEASPNGYGGGTTKISMKSDNFGKNTYTFFKGSGDCPSGCINRRYITFTVDSNQAVVLVNDTNSASGSPCASRER